MASKKIARPAVSSAVFKLSNESPFDYLEAYNNLRTNVMFSLAALDNEKKAVVVSSACPSECKSTLSSNLAISLAKLQHKVIIIDADLRRPTLHRIFGIKPDCGLSDILLNKSAENAIVGIPGLNLDFLPAGTIPPNPSELLSSKKFASFISELEKIYDYIIIDTPPILAVSDALMLSNIAAGVLLSCRYKRTSKGDFAKTVEKLKFAQFPILGTAIVGQEDQSTTRVGGYYYSSNK